MSIESNSIRKDDSKRSYKMNRKQPKVKPLEITSLIDILTILLVFLIKNVSMDSTKIVPQGMNLPTTISREKLIEGGEITVLKIYPDQILFGSSNFYNVGSPEDLINDEATRKNFLTLLKNEAKNITDLNDKSIPCILIQADNQIKCRYITELIRISGKASFANIYFSSLYETDKNKILGN